jgi:hypothetical protein
MNSGSLGLASIFRRKPGDVDVDAARQRHFVVAPHVREQLVARQRRALMLDELTQQLELAG